MKSITKFYTQFELDGEEVAQAIDAFAFRQTHASGGDSSTALARLLKGFREAHGKMVDLGEVAAVSDREASLLPPERSPVPSLAPGLALPLAPEGGAMLPGGLEQGYVGPLDKKEDTDGDG